MKFSVFTVMTPDMNPEEVLPLLKKYGYDGVEWRCKETSASLKKEAPSFWGNNLCTIDPNISEEEINSLIDASKKQGVKVISVTPYLTPGDLEETEKVMRIANKMGADMIRVGVPGYNRTKNYNDLFEQEIQYLYGVEELSKKYNVKGILETHHVTIAPSVGLTYRLVERFNPDHIGVLFDPGNMVHEGFENYRMGLELLGPYLAHVHIKNAGWQSGERRADGTLLWNAPWKPVNEGIVDWKQVLQDLKYVGYTGYLGFEDFSATKSSEEALKDNAAYITSLLEDLE